MNRKILEALASLKLTVAVMAAAMVLIFLGTLAQTSLGIWHVVDTYFRSLVAWVDLQILVPREIATVNVSVPIPGGYLVAGVMIINLLAAHAVRFRMSFRRAGIIMLHAGVVVLLLGEFVTGMFAQEGLMSIDEGHGSNFVEDIREVELVVVDPSDPGVDRVVSLPESLVVAAARNGDVLSHPDLPFEIRVDQWMPNSRLMRANGPTPANRGIGLEAFPEELPKVRGVDGAHTDVPSAYVTLSRGGESLGTWLLFTNLIESQRVVAGDGAEYGLALRYRRTYKPYTLHLIEFRHDRFTGTQIARNFSSRVRLIDPGRGTDREVLIWMNNPLRYGGATFYQASYKPDGSGTILQVVRNPGAILPYVATGLVSVGMTLHFVLGLVGFLRRRSARERSAVALETRPRVHPARRALPWAVGAFGLLLAVSGLFRAPQASEFDLERFAALPVSSGGRIKPMDSAARHVLMVAGGRQSVRTEEGRIGATEFLLDLMANPEAISGLPVVRVDHPDVLALMGLRPEEGGRISLALIEPHWATIAGQAGRALEVDSKRRDPYQRAVVSLYDRINTILAHSSMVAPYVIPPMGPEQDWQPFHDAFVASEMVVPVGHPTRGAADRSPLNPAIAWYLSMMTSYSEGDAEGFNRAVQGYGDLLWRDMPGVMRKAEREILFNRASLFMGAIKVYLLAFLLVCGAILVRMRAGGEGARWVGAAEGLRSSGFALLCAGLLVHTAAVFLRMYLQERPPVTNLYSSAVFVGWAAVLIGLLLERIHRIGIATLGASTVGFASLVVAHNLGSDGDTMQMMQAVLDSNFWLATHVVIITLGYSAAFLAGTLAVIYILLGVFTRMLNRDRSAMLSRMVYGVVCFALLLSFVGTVLGGIWADQSWGRFWGWDPKENGAALIVLITAIILHARWGGLIRERGIMVLAVGVNIVTAWSWFGTNMLGIGLHSYGFMDSAVFWMMAFVVSQMTVMAIGLVPAVVWRSHAVRNAGPVAAGGE